MRVLFITSSYPVTRDDPRGTFIHVLAASLVEHGLEMTVLAPGAPGAPKSEQRDGVQIRRATYWISRWQALATGTAGIVPNLRARPWCVIQVVPLVATLCWQAAKLARNADIVHAHWVYPAGVAGVIATRMNKRPLVVTSHGTDLNLASSYRWLAACARWVAGAATVCTAVSAAMAERFRQLGVPREQVVMLPLGIRHMEASKASALEHVPQARRFCDFLGLKVIVVGRLVPAKAVGTVLDAMSILERKGRAVAVLIVGDGPERRSLEDAASGLNSSAVIFAGNQPPDIVPSLMNLASVLVLPSLSEGRGMVIVEAMYQGIAVVASDIDGPRELIEHGVTGLLFPAGDSRALAECLTMLQCNPQLPSLIGGRGQAWIHGQGLTAQVSAERHAALYAQLIRATSDSSHDFARVINEA